MIWYRISLRYAVFSVITTNGGVIVNAAPIGKWMRGKTVKFMRTWVSSKGGTIERLDAELKTSPE